MNQVSLSGLIRNTTYWSSHTGIRWHLIISLLAFWGITFWMTQEYGGDDSTLWLVMRIFVRIVQWTLIGLLVLSIFSALLTWCWFLYQAKNKNIHADVKIGDGQQAEAGWVNQSIGIVGSALRPFFGTINARLVFTGKRLSAPVILDHNLYKPRAVWRYGIKGSGETLLHDRGIYDVEQVLVTFVDMLALVSLPARINLVRQLYTLPRASEPKTVRAQPNSTEEQKHRIDVPKRVEGEFVNYKEFETGDNIQRIVWKIYAKSGQLVVRIPEIKDPYASHLYFYVSYFHGLNMNTGAFETELLNVYKDKVRHLFEAVQKNGYEVRIPHDQEVPKLTGVSEKKNELFQITAANWQNAMPPVSFVHPGKAAMVCLPSLVPAEEIATMMKNLPESVPLVVVQLSDAIPSPFRIALKDILFRPERKPSDSLRQPWLISALRRDMMKNEKAVSALLKQRPNSWLTNTIQFE